MASLRPQKASIELQAVYRVSEILGTSPDVGRTFREALVVLCSMLDWHCAAVVQPDEKGVPVCTESVGPLSDPETVLDSQVNVEVIGKVFRSGTAMVALDTAEAPFFLNADPPPKADGAWQAPTVGIAMPIKADWRVLGVFAIERAASGRSGTFDEDLCVLSTVATLMGQKLLLNENVHRRQKHRYGEVQPSPGPAEPRYQIDAVIGESSRMQRVFKQVHQAASTKATVLLRGESGTGKEVIAQALHRLSPRRDAPFVRVNCAVLAETLLESELFGHEKGAFTGAHGTRKGRFELAHGGTLFLDEIGDISLSFQAKLLRVLQEREFERVGGTTPIKVDVRVVLATNRPLEKMVASGTFRADLYYRVNVVSIELPPLRKRREDIPLMIEYFLDRFNRENQREVRITPMALKVLTSCYWPGNVRELENCIERAVVMTTDDELTDLSFPCHDNRCLAKLLHCIERDDEREALKPASVPVDVGRAEAHRIVVPEFPFEDAAAPTLPEKMPENQRDRLIWALEKCGGVQTRAARLLNLTPRQIWYALKKHNVVVSRF